MDKLVVFSNYDEARDVRKLMQTELSVRSMQQWKPVFAREIHRFIHRIMQGGDLVIKEECER